MRTMMLLFPLLVACKGKDEPTDEVEATCAEASGRICPWAGTGLAAYDGDGKHRLDSMFYWPMDVTISPYGRPLIADWNNHKIRIVEDDDTLRTVMGTDFVGDGPEDKADLVAPGADGTTVNLNHPTEQIYMPDGMMVSASWHTHKIRSWDPATGLVMVIAGSTPGYDGDEAAATAAHFNQPKSVLADSAGNIYVVDMRNERIRQISPDGIVHAFAGSGTQDDCGDDGAMADACFRFPKSANPEPGGALAFSADESQLFVADTENHRIRVIDMATGIISAFAGTGVAGFAGDEGAALGAQFNYPRDLALTDDNRLLVADTDNNRIRSIDLETGVVSTLAGDGTAGDAGDGGPSTDAVLYRPFGVAAGQNGEVYIADTFNHRIRVVYP